MRFRTALGATLAAFAIALAVAGCQSGPTGPYTPSAPPPSGLNVSLAAVRLDPAAPVPDPSITAAGDSVVATAILSVNCSDWVVRAGIADGVLVITVVDSMPVAGRNCLAISTIANYRAVVHPAPPGRYDVVLRQRVTGAYQAPQEREMIRGRVEVR